MDNLIGTHWHHLPASEVVELLESDQERGLDRFSVEHRQKEYGPNRITTKRETPAIIRFLLQFHQPLVYILIASGIITAFLGEWVDSGVIFGVVMVNAVIGYIQEAKAVNALAALARTMTAEATVVRAGEKRRLSAEELVPGDVVLLQSGDKVPADLRLLKLRDLQIDEAALTGESLPVAKKEELLAHETLLADRTNMAYAATLVTYGQGLGIVTAIGDHTEVGRISQLIAEAEELETPLTRKIGEFSNLLLYVILGLAAVTVAVGMWRGESFVDMFMAAVALAVGAIPEGLPAAVTVTLAIGVGRMARRRAIIRKLPAVETLGSTTVICSDKTGTLTENQMTVQAIWAGGAAYRVSGAGYDPAAGCIENADLASLPAVAECLKAGALCNDSTLVEAAGEWQVHGDPTEGALLVAARKGGLDPARLAAELPRRDSLPFESQHQYMATLHQTDEDGRIYVKGGAEVVLAACSGQLDQAGATVPLDAGRIQAEVERMAVQGLRVLALASKPWAGERIGHDSVAGGLTLLGLEGMIDPPRPEAIQAVRTCQQAGVRVKMITGDHAITAAAIAGQMGLDGIGGTQVRALTGQDLARLTDRELMTEAERTAVFARVSPEQKLRLVEALQAHGHVVAMTGDGVNDAPALKQADIGVAMGITGTEVAKEAAAMVLTDDNFSSIEAAVEEGRGVFDNLIKFIVWALPTNMGQGLVIMASIFLAVALPILPVQILWINMTTAGILGLALAFEPKEPGIMARPPRNPKSPMLGRPLIVRMCLMSLLLMVSAFGLFAWELDQGGNLAEARTVAVNTFVVMELFYLFNCRSLTRQVHELPLFSNPLVFGGAVAMLLLQVAYTYVPVMNRLFASAPIELSAWLAVFGAGVASLVMIEVEKWIQRPRAAA
ncbi:MAG: cation-transporting P-type ATPase [Thermodesulfobacteriota bacterium]